MEGNSYQAPVEVSDLKKAFGDQIVLNGITLKVAQGQTVAVLGRSGTGKSVLLKLLAGLQEPDSGSVRIAGQEITGLATAPLNEIRKTIGFLFQQAALYDSLTVWQNVEFPLTRHADLSKSACKDKVRELLLNVGLTEEDFDKLPSETSGGMQKRVGLARALALDPSILLLDEPTSGQDPITTAEIANLITGLKKTRGITNVVVTHDIHAARDFCDLLVLLNEGNIIAKGTYEDLKRNKDKFVSRFLGDDGA